MSQPAKKPWFLSREKSSTSGFWSSRNSTRSSSNYWLRDSIFDKQQTILDRVHSIDEDMGKIDYYQLAKYQRAISNFVRILTGRSDIAVRYPERGKDSYTDGKTITLATNIKDGEFDSAVGLALHESSHIMYTDFDAWNSTLKSYPTNEVQKRKLLLNLVEDLFIDAQTYKSAPGYRGYYAALYQKYFGDAKIVRGMWSVERSLPTWDNYAFHLVNIRNPQRNVNALPGLIDMFTMLDLPNILRLKKFNDRVELASKLFDEIVKYTQAFDELTEHIKGTGKAGDSSDNTGVQTEPLTQEELNEWLEGLTDEDIENMANGSNSSDNDDDYADGNDWGDSDDADGNDDDDADGNDGSDSESTDGNSDGFVASNGINIGKQLKKSVKVNTANLSNSARESLKKLFEKQQDLINGTISKGSLTQDNISRINAMASVDMDQKVVGTDISQFSDKGITLQVINRLTESFISSLGVPYGIYPNHSENHSNRIVENGINRGRLLAKKLQLRNEERVLKTSRLNNGKIDKRLLHEVGFDNFDIFSKININTYKPSYIHLSIDQSGSMQGSYFDGAIELAAMFATASKYIENIHLQVSIRSTVGFNGRPTPYIIYVFDSKIDSIQTIRRIFPMLRAHGLTPEGLAFEGIMKEIHQKSRNTDAYFINICDGVPHMIYNNSFRYAYEAAQQHTRKQMHRMEREGIKFITYFIGGSSAFRHVQNCYGDNAVLLSSANELTNIARAMNKKLL